jgi:uncharacterized repeat protein (TIGR03803 family)
MFAAILMMLVPAITAPAQTFTTLVNFDGPNGVNPKFGNLVQGIDGSLFGTTYLGGTYASGTVFKVTPRGTLTTLYSFCAQPNCADGAYPAAQLARGIDGNFYGVTVDGGTENWGTVFKITPVGVLTTLHSFAYTDGAEPQAQLVLGSDGSFYGLAFGGGTYGYGTAFSVTPAGKLTTFYDFQGTDGWLLNAGLIQGADGDFYGTTFYGGAYNQGMVFKLTRQGTLTTLYSFCSQSRCADGEGPNGALVQAIDGDFYGTTAGGGTGASCRFGCGTVFKITAQGILATLHTFEGADGQSPYAGLIQATDGNFYGTTYVGGRYSEGTVFKITPLGGVTTLHSFNGTDGNDIFGGLVQATNGDIYGATFDGGTGSCLLGCGTAFGVALGLDPFVETVPALGKVAKYVTILGTNLSGATSVTFNSTPATFTVVSPTAIKTIVPTGATTGPVQVVTPSATLTSNVNFQVLP